MIDRLNQAEVGPHSTIEPHHSRSIQYSPSHCALFLQVVVADRDAALTQQGLVITGLEGNLTDLRAALSEKEVTITDLQVTN